jgi:acetyl-CoA synthetase
VEKLIVVKRAANEILWQENSNFWWHELVKGESDNLEPEIMDSEDLLFILFTSGTTGIPKGCIHTCGGYTVQANFTGKWIFDLKEDDIFWCTSDPGWITGHTYTIYSPLLNGVTTLMFEGVPDWPTPDRWCQIIEKHKVTTFYTAPTAIRMFEKYTADLLKKYKFETLQILGSVGEPIDEGAWQWYFKEVGKERCPIVDTWWQTESGGILITSLPGVGPFKPAFCGLPFPGTKFDILDEKGKSCPVNKEGNLVMFPPFAPGLLRGIYQDPEKYKKTYFSQYGEEIYFTSDGALKDENGLIRIVGRVDDVIKVAGHRIATGELENAISKHPDITESAVVGIPDEIKGEVPVAFVVSKSERPLEDLKKEVIEQVKKEIGPIALPKEVFIVEDLPKTRSGKIMRRILRKLFVGEELGDLSTLANPESVEKIKKIIGK